MYEAVVDEKIFERWIEHQHESPIATRKLKQLGLLEPWIMYTIWTTQENAIFINIEQERWSMFDDKDMLFEGLGRRHRQWKPVLNSNPNCLNFLKDVY